MSQLTTVQPAPIERHGWHGDSRTADYIQNSKARSTRIGYPGDWRRFTAWCRAEGFASMPADPVTVARFATARAQQGKTVAHIRRELAAIAFVHRDRGHESPTGNAGVRATRQGVARSHPYVKKQAPAIYPAHLLAMVEALDLKTYRGALRRNRGSCHALLIRIHVRARVGRRPGWVR
jgi:hypothetical protein